MARVIEILRATYGIGMGIGLLSGGVSAALFLFAFISGSTTLCGVASVLMISLIPVVALVVLAGLAVIYLDPNESHAFRVGEKS